MNAVLTRIGFSAASAIVAAVIVAFANPANAVPVGTMLSHFAGHDTAKVAATSAAVPARTLG